MSGAALLGKAIERAVGLREGLYSIAFPRGISRELVSSLVQSANEKASEINVVGYCIEVTDLTHSSHLRVHTNEVIKVRAGSHRLVVGEEGCFEPDRGSRSHPSLRCSGGEIRGSARASG